MCGIAGVYNFGLQKSVTAKHIEEMCRPLIHRGPDEQGIYLSAPDGQNRVRTGLGHRRLKIIDLNTGNQPIYNENKTVVVVFNGEIYNFQELRENLITKGHRFYTKTDTEVIVHLYEEYGKACVQHLRGMFAFAIWDEKTHKLFLARDRVGKKPLVYAVIHDTLIFASELKGLLTWADFHPTINLEAIHYFLTYQYIPSPTTIFKEIKKLPPAHVLECDEQGRVEISRYWRLSYQPKLVSSEQEIIDELKTKLTEAVRLRMISDVPLGAFLSGGVDSSIIVGIMSQLSSQPVKTFSIGFKEDDYSELPFARMVAEKFKTHHHEFVVEPQAIEILPKLVWHYNEPFGDASALPSYYVAQQTRKCVTVALNGDGGDESFAGYLRYQAHYWANMFSFLTPLLNTTAAKKVIELMPHSYKPKDIMRTGKRFLQAMSDPAAIRNILWHCIFNNTLKDQLYSPEMKNGMKGIDTYHYLSSLFDNAGDNGFVDKLLFTDVHSYLPEDLLVKMDIATMANSLETRSPFLDHEIMEFAASIPANLKLRHGRGKFILKKAFEDFLPREIISRRKMGFGVPLEHWFRNDLKDYIRDVLLSSSSIKRGYFRKDSIELLLREHAEHKRDHGYRLWNLLVLELWHQVYIDGSHNVE